jgi:nickel-dependent lactate racemase
MKTNLRYGRHGLDMELPDGSDIRIFRTKDMPVIENPRGHLRRCLKRPMSGAPLEELASGKKSACVVVSDITRPVPNSIVAPPIIDALERAGIPSSRIHILVATGIHRAPTRGELSEILGDELPARYSVISHDARDPSATVKIGHSSNGIPVEINRTYIESDLKIITGLVEPHFMAGYSGGRKSVAIGLASVDMVRHLHGTGFLEHPGAKNCELKNNPLHAELTEIARIAGADFCVNVVIDAERRIGGIFCGDMALSHRAACEFSERHCTIRVDTLSDIVVSTAAGYPLDTTYYQGVKGLAGALDILAPGGSIVLASECSKGLGSNEFRLMLERLRSMDDYDEFLEYISEPGNFMIDQWEVEMLVKALRNAKIFLFSTGIPEMDWPLTFATKVKSMEEGLSLAIDRSRQSPRISVIPEGPYFIPLRNGAE